MIIETLQLEAYPVKAIIGLHGWSGDEQSLLPVARGVRCREAHWLLPRGPYPAQDGDGFAWFAGSDRRTWQADRSFILLDELLAGLREDGFAAADIYFCGFSMGACLALEYALRLPHALGGIVPIAGFIRDPQMLAKAATAASRATPVLLLHGAEDEIVPSESSQTAYQFLKDRGQPVTLELYPAAHKIPVDRFGLIRGFIAGDSVPVAASAP
ncbi:MAG: dienelactone hydrolase family protein [Candidatus Neomarinimicrobiota bacterium]